MNLTGVSGNGLLEISTDAKKSGCIAEERGNVLKVDDQRERSVRCELGTDELQVF